MRGSWDGIKVWEVGGLDKEIRGWGYLKGYERSMGWNKMRVSGDGILKWEVVGIE